MEKYKHFHANDLYKSGEIPRKTQITKTEPGRNQNMNIL